MSTKTFEAALDRELEHMGVDCPISRHDIVAAHQAALEAKGLEARIEELRGMASWSGGVMNEYTHQWLNDRIAQLQSQLKAKED